MQFLKQNVRLARVREYGMFEGQHRRPYIGDFPVGELARKEPTSPRITVWLGVSTQDASPEQVLSSSQQSVAHFP
jgi:hypothetical protein